MSSVVRLNAAFSTPRLSTGISAGISVTIRRMKPNIAFAATVFLVFAGAALPLESYKATAEETQRIRTKLDEMDALVRPLIAKRGAGDPLLADVAVYQKAAEWALRFPDEFYRKEYVDKTFAA